MDQQAIMERLQNTLGLTRFIKRAEAHKQLGGNCPTVLEVIRRDLALPRVPGDEDVRQRLQDYLDSPP